MKSQAAFPPSTGGSCCAFSSPSPKSNCETDRCGLVLVLRDTVIEAASKLAIARGSRAGERVADEEALRREDKLRLVEVRASGSREAVGVRASW